MIRRIFTVGGWTLISRVTGFVRDVVMAAVLGAGPIADAFLVAFRLPNHFRAIFAEGAFSAAFVPSYTKTLEQDGRDAARRFADRIAGATVFLQIVLLAIALTFTPQLVSLLAPGLRSDPLRFELAVALTRITFPYLALMALETLIAGTLNANRRFASAAAAPVLLNVCMVSALLTAALFPTAGHAAAWAVLAAGVLQVLLVAGDAQRNGFGLRIAMPKFDDKTKQFLKALGPALIGAGGVQLALFADTIIATFLPAGALSALYYADRIHQLPIGVVGIAVGIVLLPEMSRRLATGDQAGAANAQGKAIELTFLITLPFVAGAIAIPELVMRALFMRGAFTADDALAAAVTLAAYGTGLIPFVLIRSFVAPFYARGDTATPVKAALIAVLVNVLLKIVLVSPLAQVGLALATSIGAWINLAILAFAARRMGYANGIRSVELLMRLLIAGMALGGLLYGGELLLKSALPSAHGLRDELHLLILLALGGFLYVILVITLLGRDWLRGLARDSGSATSTPDLPPRD